MTCLNVTAALNIALTGVPIPIDCCPMHNKEVFDFAPHSPGAADYRALIQELWGSGFFV